MSEDTDIVDLTELVATFFAAFASGPGLDERMATLRAVLLPGARIVKTCGGEPEVYDVDGFIEPRRALLASDAVTDFREWPLTGRTDVFGDVAHWFGGYAKAWTVADRPQRGAGIKSIQFVRTGDGWRISAAAWDDERDGLSLPNEWAETPR